MSQKVEFDLQSCLHKVKPLIDEQSWRVQLAAAYHLIEKFRMADLVCTHISVRLPGTADQFLGN